jgi:hypothetical protein
MANKEEQYDERFEQYQETDENPVNLLGRGANIERNIRKSLTNVVDGR